MGCRKSRGRPRRWPCSLPVGGEASAEVSQKSTVSATPLSNGDSVVAQSQQVVLLSDGRSGVEAIAVASQPGDSPTFLRHLKFLGQQFPVFRGFPTRWWFVLTALLQDIFRKKNPVMYFCTETIPGVVRRELGTKVHRPGPNNCPCKCLCLEVLTEYMEAYASVADAFSFSRCVAEQLLGMPSHLLPPMAGCVGAFRNYGTAGRDALDRALPLSTGAAWAEPVAGQDASRLAARSAANAARAERAERRRLRAAAAAGAASAARVDRVVRVAKVAREARQEAFIAVSSSPSAASSPSLATMSAPAPVPVQQSQSRPVERPAQPRIVQQSRCVQGKKLSAFRQRILTCRIGHHPAGLRRAVCYACLASGQPCRGRKETVRLGPTSPCTACREHGLGLRQCAFPISFIAGPPPDGGGSFRATPCHICYSQGPFPGSSECFVCKQVVCPMERCRRAARIGEGCFQNGVPARAYWYCCHCLGVPHACGCEASGSIMKRIVLHLPMPDRPPLHLLNHGTEVLPVAEVETEDDVQVRVGDSWLHRYGRRRQWLVEEHEELRLQVDFLRHKCAASDPSVALLNSWFAILPWPTLITQRYLLDLAEDFEAQRPSEASLAGGPPKPGDTAAVGAVVEASSAPVRVISPPRVYGFHGRILTPPACCPAVQLEAACRQDTSKRKASAREAIQTKAKEIAPRKRSRPCDFRRPPEDVCGELGALLQEAMAAPLWPPSDDDETVL